MKRVLQSIISDSILKKIADKGTDKQKVDAAKTILASNIIKNKREKAREGLAPIPTPHAEGEDRETYDARNKTNLPGKHVRGENDNASSDQAVNEAYDAAGDTFRFYLDVYKRSSVDGNGMTLTSTVHFDKNFDNAFWDGTQMVYGDGSFFNPFTRDLTVIGHELTHGVTQYTANLTYQDQPGALNEHISDAMGSLVEQYVYKQTADKATWLIGKLLVEGKIKGRGLRDMLNPGTAYDDPIIGKDPQGADMDHYDPTSEDNGGVHINSGILNRAFATACVKRGGKAWETIGKVWYTVLTTKLGSDAQFQNFAALTYTTAGELFGANSVEQQAVLAGWKLVKIDPTVTPAPAPVPAPHQLPCMTDLLSFLNNAEVLGYLNKAFSTPAGKTLLARARLLGRDL